MFEKDAVGDTAHFLQDFLHLSLAGDGGFHPGKLLRRECQADGFLPGVFPTPLVAAAAGAFFPGKDASLADEADPGQVLGQTAVPGFQPFQVSGSFFHGPHDTLAVKGRRPYIYGLI